MSKLNPDINKHWCKYCRIHGKFRIKKTTHTSDSGSTTNTHYMCTKCGEEMFIPKDSYQIGNNNFIIKIILFISSIALFMAGLFKGIDYLFNDGLVLIVFIIFAVIVGFALQSYYSRFYNEWEKWAKGQKSEVNNVCEIFKKELSDFKDQEDKRSKIQTKSLVKGFGCVILFIIGFFLFALILLALVLSTVDNY